MQGQSQGISEENQNSNEYNGNGEDGFDQKERKKRRSKNDLDGRSFKCKHCEKTYLSEIALNNHVKNKHSHLVEIVSRGRGRPRKLNQGNENLSNGTSNDFRFKVFFESGFRIKSETEFNLIEAAKENFDNIFNKYKEKLFKDLESPSSYPLINPPQPEGTNTTCDFALWKYLEFCKEKTNREYFDFLFKFIVLFRECINQKKGARYTIEQTADPIPDMCNDFVAEFMEAHDYFGLDVQELIEAIQHCCNWLWENHYTSSRLTLVNS